MLRSPLHTVIAASYGRRPVVRAPAGALPVADAGGATHATDLCETCVRIDPTVPPWERIEMLNRYSMSAANDPEFRAFVRDAFAPFVARLASEGRAPSADDVLQWAMDTVHDLVDYAIDPPGEEIFQPVWTTIRNGKGESTSPITGYVKGGGDCDKMAALFVAMALVLGFWATNVWVDQPNSAQNHVRAAACHVGTHASTSPAGIASDAANASPLRVTWQGCKTIEATIPGAFPGESTDAALRRVGFRGRVYGSAGSPTRPAGEGETTPTHAVRVVGSPRGSMVDVDGVATTLLPSTDPSHPTFLLPEGVEGRHVVRLVTPSGEVRQWTGEVPARGEFTLRFDAMEAVTPTGATPTRPRPVLTPKRMRTTVPLLAPRVSAVSASHAPTVRLTGMPSGTQVFVDDVPCARAD